MGKDRSSNSAVSVGEDLIPELQDCRLQIETIKQDSHDLLAGLTEKQFNWRPQPGIWSIAECIDHLNVTGRKFIPYLDKMIDTARKDGYLSEGPFRHGFFGNLMIKFSEPPPKFKIRAPKVFAPSPDQPMAKVVPEFMSLQEELLERVRSSNGLDLARVKRHSPATKLVKLDLGQWLKVILAHERRHLWQARQIKNDSQFP
jgi:hypothetical protein